MINLTILTLPKLVMEHLRPVEARPRGEISSFEADLVAARQRARRRP